MVFGAPGMGASIRTEEGWAHHGFACNTHKPPAGVSKRTHLPNTPGKGGSVQNLGAGKQEELSLFATAKTSLGMQIRRNKQAVRSQGEENTDNRLWDWLRHGAGVSLPLRLLAYSGPCPAARTRNVHTAVHIKRGLSSAHRVLSKSPDAGSAATRPRSHPTPTPGTGKQPLWCSQVLCFSHCVGFSFVWKSGRLCARLCPLLGKPPPPSRLCLWPKRMVALMVEELAEVMGRECPRLSSALETG